MSAQDMSGFTAGESKLLLSILKHLSGDIQARIPHPLASKHSSLAKRPTDSLRQTDWAAVAAELSYKDGAIAKQRWGQIKRKKNIGGATGSSPAKKGAAPVKKGGGRKRKASDVGEGSEEDLDGGEAEVKKGKKGKKAKAREVEEEEAEAEVKEEAVEDGVEGEFF